ncbi:MAG: hypothetical protein AAF790_01100 [Planctomycetota bacterium]
MSDAQAMTTVDVSCPHCGSMHPVRRQVLGKLAKCTSCSQRFVLRAPAPEQHEGQQEGQQEAAASQPAATPVAAEQPLPNARESLAIDPSHQGQTPPAFRQPPPRVSAAPFEAANPPPPPPPISVDPVGTGPAANEPPVAALPDVEPLPAVAVEAPASSKATRPPEPSPTPRASKTLSLASSLVSVLAVVWLGAGVVWAAVLVVVTIASVDEAATFVVAFGVIGYVLLVAVAGAAGIYLCGQLLRMIVLIEQNTRQAADACRAMQEGQPAAGTPLEAGGPPP